MAAGRDFGTLINERRLELGYSLGQLANRVRATASDVRAWERGQQAPNAALVARLAKELELDPEELGGAAQQVRQSTAKLEPPDDDKTAVVAAAVFSDDAHTESVHPGDGEQVVAVAKEERASAPEPAPERAPDPPRAQTPPATAFDDDEDAADDEEYTRPDPMPGERPFWEEPGEDDATALVAAAQGAPETDGLVTGDAPETDPIEDSPDGPALTDLPTEAVPVVPAAPVVAASSPPEPVATVLAPSRPATATQPSQAAASSGAFEPFTSFLRTLFDPDRRYLFWLRTVLTIIVFLVFLRILAWAVPAFFDTLGEILDTIESTPTETTLIPGG